MHSRIRTLLTLAVAATAVLGTVGSPAAATGVRGTGASTALHTATPGRSSPGVVRAAGQPARAGRGGTQRGGEDDRGRCSPDHRAAADRDLARRVVHGRCAGPGDRTEASPRGEGRTTPVFVTYAVPNRDCGGYSAGGLSPSQYAEWNRRIAADLRGHRAVVIVEPDRWRTELVHRRSARRRRSSLPPCATSPRPALPTYLDGRERELEQRGTAGDLPAGGRCRAGPRLLHERRELLRRRRRAGLRRADSAR